MSRQVGLAVKEVRTSNVRVLTFGLSPVITFFLFWVSPKKERKKEKRDIKRASALSPSLKGPSIGPKTLENGNNYARVMRVAVPIPAVASASVFHSAAGGGSVVDVVRPL